METIIVALGLLAYWKNVENKGEADEWEMEIARAVTRRRLDTYVR